MRACGDQLASGAERQLRAQFAAGAASDIEEGKEFLARPALEAFGDIAGDGECRAFHLVAQAEASMERLAFGHIVEGVSEVHCSLPDGQILEALVRCHRTTP